MSIVPYTPGRDVIIPAMMGLARFAMLQSRKRKRLDDEWAGVVKNASKHEKAGGGGVYHGKWRSKLYKPKSAKLVRGYSERNSYGGTVNNSDCCYLGITSYPCYYGTYNGASEIGNDSKGGRQLTAIMVALLRHFFQYVHPGKWEIESPDEPLKNYVTALSTTVNASSVPSTTAVEGLVIVYSDEAGTPKVTGANLTLTTTATLRTLAKSFADQISAKWKEGYEPLYMKCYYRANLATNEDVTIPGSMMRLNNIIVSTRCTTVCTVQNQTLADLGSGTTNLAHLTNNIGVNPLRGRLLYFKHIAPDVTVGMGIDPSGGATEGATGAMYTNDGWFSTNLTLPISDTTTSAYCGNVYTSTVDPTGVWSDVPKPDYFKGLRCVRDVQMDAGEIKTFKLRFKFRGTLTDWLRRDNSNYLNGSTLAVNKHNAGFRSGMGQCAFLCLQRVMKEVGTSKIALVYTVDTYLHANVIKKKQVMTVATTQNVN